MHMKFCAVFFGVPVLAFLGLGVLSWMGEDSDIAAILMLMGVFLLIGTLIGAPDDERRRINR